MNFFRSEEHLRRWEGYDEKLDGGKIGLDSLIQLVGQPYFTSRGGPDYVSHFSEYIAGLVGELDNLPDAGDFFKLSPVLKAAFNLAIKLRILQLHDTHPTPVGPRLPREECELALRITDDQAEAAANAFKAAVLRSA